MVLLKCFRNRFSQSGLKAGLFVRHGAKGLTSQKAVIMKNELAFLGVFGTIAGI